MGKVLDLYPDPPRLSGAVLAREAATSRLIPAQS